MELSSSITSVSAADEDDHHYQLLQAVARKDKYAFENLYAIYHRRLSRLLLRFFDRYGIVEEIINDTMLVVWEKSGNFENRSKVSTWIMGIAYRRMSKTFKRFDRMRERDQAYAEGTAGIDVANGEPQFHQQQQELTRDWLRKAMSQLKAEQRLMLEFVYYCGYSCEEISTITQMPIGTVKTRLFQARQQLKITLPALAEPCLDQSSTSINRGGYHEPR